MRQKRQAALAVGVERAFELEATLELLQASAELAHIVELDLVDDEAEPSGLAEEIDPAAEDEHLAVLGQRRDAPRVVREQHRIEPAEPILDGEVVVPGSAALHAADLALDEEGGQGTQLASDLVGELGDREGPLSFLGSEHVG